MNTEQWLGELCNTPSGPYLRPFAPNPRWKEADVFIVGRNPATPLRDEFESFDAFWESLTKVPDRFLAIYRTKHGGEASKTTTRVSMLKQSLEPLNVLVTNACSYPAAGGERIPREQWRIGAQIFDRLLRQCTPGAIFSYGADAVRLAENYLGADLDPLAPPEHQSVSALIPRTRHPVWLFACFHLTGQGLPKGYKVDDIADYLERFARRIRECVPGRR